MRTLNTAKLDGRIARARSACNRGISYGLGQGGMEPRDDLPTRNARCDCSGFAAWGLSLDRFQGDKGKLHSKAIPWIETTAIARDATGAQRLFQQIEKPVPGCLVVYGDRKVLGRKREGHIGFVSEVRNRLDFDVIHCSVGNDRKGDAIQETHGALFVRANAIFVVLVEDFQ